MNKMNKLILKKVVNDILTIVFLILYLGTGIFFNILDSYWDPAHGIKVQWKNIQKEAAFKQPPSALFDARFF